MPPQVMIPQEQGPSAQGVSGVPGLSAYATVNHTLQRSPYYTARLAVQSSDRHLAPSSPGPFLTVLGYRENSVDDLSLSSAQDSVYIQRTNKKLEILNGGMPEWFKGVALRKGFLTNILISTGSPRGFEPHFLHRCTELVFE